jgi:hypothetical protein
VCVFAAVCLDRNRFWPIQRISGSESESGVEAAPETGRPSAPEAPVPLPKMRTALERVWAA